ncbi:uncharacterized protein HaLaN_26361 [Haematococcus lacustris]|uniref:Uncharacterized protein n=1 Tax=Haematococcus lacustris TaxID=44745 RepID=A0A6A0A622_HAELA|nr:uncharacterized protein HaLaN_26361 [Haematococcus lacustris]
MAWWLQTRRMEHLGVMGTLRLLWRTEGWAGLFRCDCLAASSHNNPASARGNYASVVRIVPYSATHFAVYEHYRRLLVDHVIAPAATVRAAGANTRARSMRWAQSARVTRQYQRFSFRSASLARCHAKICYICLPRRWDVFDS